jgi:tectonic-1/3
VVATEATPSDTRNVDIGTCVCDLTYLACDANCFCDSDCSTTEKARFTEILDAGPVAFSVQKCVDDDLIEVNKRGGIHTTLVDNMLCVELDNNPGKGQFFTDPGTPTDSSFQSLSAALASSYQPVALVASTSATDDENYKVGQTVRAAHDDGTGTLFAANGGNFVVPAAAPFGGLCSDASFAQYLEPSRNTCRRASDDFRDACRSGGAFDSERYTVNLKIAKFRDAQLGVAASWLTLTMTALEHVDSATGTVTALTPSNTAVVDPIFDDVTCSCNNALLSAEYLLGYELNGLLATAKVAVQVGTVYGTGTGATCTAASFDQTFAVVYNSSAAVRIDEIRPKSGNPGYIVGMPVIFGTPVVSGAKSAVAQLVGGLAPLPQTNGVCDAVSGTQSDVITFGEDALYGCTVALRLQELKTLCPLGLPAMLNVTETLVAQWGDSDYLNSFEWTTIVKNALPTAAWSEAKRTCVAMSNTMNIEFLTADIGAVANPQRKILRARVHYSSLDWVFASENDTAVQHFPVRVAVTFINLAPGALTDFVPESPPLLPKFPRDVLYPLYDNAAASSPSVVVTRFVALPLLALAMIWCAVGWR